MSNPASTEKIEKFRKIFEQEVEKKRILDAKYADGDVKDGETYIRILPNKDPNKHFFLKSGFHKIFGEYYNCPKEFKNAKCPICEYVSKLYRSTQMEDVELARELKKVKRYYYNVVVRGAEDKGVRILTSGIKLFEKIIGACANPEIGDISDAKEGYDFIIKKRMKDGYWNYDLSEASRRASPLNPDSVKAEAWIQSQYDLEQEVTINTYQELKEVLDNALNNRGTGTTTVSASTITTEVAKPVFVKQEAPTPTPISVAAPVAPVVAPVLEEEVVEEEEIDDEIAKFRKNLEELRKV
jgi:hypothetical protein